MVEMAPGFLFYLHTFFQDEGMLHLADSLDVAAPPVHLADVVRDLKRGLKPDLYEWWSILFTMSRPICLYFNLQNSLGDY